MRPDRDKNVGNLCCAKRFEIYHKGLLTGVT